MKDWRLRAPSDRSISSTMWGFSSKAAVRWKNGTGLAFSLGSTGLTANTGNCPNKREQIRSTPEVQSRDEHSAGVSHIWGWRCAAAVHNKIKCPTKILLRRQEVLPRCSLVMFLLLTDTSRLLKWGSVEKLQFIDILLVVDRFWRNRMKIHFASFFSSNSGNQMTSVLTHKWFK